MSDLPVILLAFANDLDGKRYLRDLPVEMHEVRQVLESERARLMCLLRVVPNATLETIQAEFDRYGQRIKIFHYGGHAGPEGLHLESDQGAKVAFADGLARYLGMKGVELVFLNGCSTGPQALALHDAGVDAVIATSRSIEDTVARSFATRFYQELVNGHTFADSFELASAGIRSGRGSDPRAYIHRGDATRHMGPEDVTDEFGFPWDIHVRSGAEAVGRLTLPQMAGDPLLGLPPLPPPDYLEPMPYRYLQPFTAEFAHVFFGRGQAIADLYNRVISPDPRRVIFYSGPTGVGKSSVLDAGLLPRLKLHHEVRYVRRDAAAGLLGTLRRALNLPAGSGSADDLALAWSTSDKPDRPLVVILDQAEEAFTRPHPKSRTPQAEVDTLVAALKSLFDGPARGSKGRLMLGFRKEWLQEFERSFQTNRLGFDSVTLSPLEHDGIVEAIEGPSKSPAKAVRTFYDLHVEDGLAESIAAYLLADAGSALAPTLQVLLSKMWEAAGGKGAKFTEWLYVSMRLKGILLEDILKQGLEQLTETQPSAAKSGFGLDLLEFHTTELGTAESRSLKELAARYPHRPDLNETVRALESGYLLVGSEAPKPTDPLQKVEDSSRRTRLCHDTLAPLVQKEFRNSQQPGPRAARLLAARAQGWKDGKTGETLTENQLKLVEEGLPATGTIYGDPKTPGQISPEARCIEASRIEVMQVKERENKRSRLIKGLQYAAALASVIAVFFAAYSQRQKAEAEKQTSIANVKTKLADKKSEEAQKEKAEAEKQKSIAIEQKNISESRRLANLANAAIDTDFMKAAALAVEAFRASPTMESREAFQRVLDFEPQIDRIYSIDEGEVTAVAVGQSGEVAIGFVNVSGCGVVTFDATGKTLSKMPFKKDSGRVTHLAFDRRGGILVAVRIHEKVAQGTTLEFIDFEGNRLSDKPAWLDSEELVELSYTRKGEIVTVTEDNLEIRTVDRWKLSEPNRTERLPGGRVIAFAISQNGTMAAVLQNPIEKNQVRDDSSGTRKETFNLVIFDENLNTLTEVPIEWRRLTRDFFDNRLQFGSNGLLYVLNNAGQIQKALSLNADQELKDEKWTISDMVRLQGEHGLTWMEFNYRVNSVSVERLRYKSTKSRIVREQYRLDRIDKMRTIETDAAPESFVVLTSDKKQVLAFDRASKIIRKQPVSSQTSETIEFVIGPDGSIAMLGIENKLNKPTTVVRLIDSQGSIVREIRLDDPNQGEMTCIALDKNQDLIIGFAKVDRPAFDQRRAESPPPDILVATGFVRVDAKSGSQKTAEFANAKGKVTKLFCSPDGGHILAELEGNDNSRKNAKLVMMSDTGKLIWSSAILERIPDNLNDVRVNSVAFDTDGRIAVGFEGSIVDPVTGKRSDSGGIVEYDRNGNQIPRQTMEVPEGKIRLVRYGPHSMLATVLVDEEDKRNQGMASLVVFDVFGRRVLPRPIMIDEGEPVGMAFQDSGVIRIGILGTENSENGNGDSFRIFECSMEPGAWARTLGDVVNRNLSAGQWIEAFPDQPYRRTFGSAPDGSGVKEAVRSGRLEYGAIYDGEL